MARRPACSSGSDSLGESRLPPVSLLLPLVPKALVPLAMLLILLRPVWGDVLFSDVTAAAGIGHVQHTSVPEEFFQSYMSGGAAAGDYDGDGWVDLYVTRLDGSDILYRNLGDGTFADATSAAFGEDHLAEIATNGAAWGDIDNDGDLDLYVTSIYANRYHLFINNGEGGFSEEAALRGAALESSDTHFGFSVTFGDYDDDGFLDIHTTEWRMDLQNPSEAPQNTRLLRNLGSANPGSFTDVTTPAGVAMDSVVASTAGFDSQSFASRFSDLDGDGHVDLAITSDHGTSRLFWNRGDGTFEDGTFAAGVGSDQFGMGSAIGDVDNDGDLDWFVTSIYQANNASRSGNRLYVNEGARQFADGTDAAAVRDGYWGWGTAMSDFDNDGDLDIVETNGQRFPFAPLVSRGYEQTPMKLWLNAGDGRFNEVADEFGLSNDGSGKGLLTFDYDRDGDLDLFVVNNGDAAVLYRNDGGNESAWLAVQTVGSHSNRQGLGARIVLDPAATAEGDERLREMDAGSHFLGQSESVAHFGLGTTEPTIHRVTIFWPSGVVQQFFNVAPRQRLTVVEPESSGPLCDMDWDGDADFDDLDEFVLGLSDPDAYRDWYGVLPSWKGDTDFDGDLDYDDIAGLAAVLSGPLLAVPEPHSSGLGMLLFTAFVFRKRR